MEPIPSGQPRPAPTARPAPLHRSLRRLRQPKVYLPVGILTAITLAASLTTCTAQSSSEPPAPDSDWYAQAIHLSEADDLPAGRRQVTLAILDSGFNAGLPGIHQIKSAADCLHTEHSPCRQIDPRRLTDDTDHGTQVTTLVTSRDPQRPGIAPNIALQIIKIAHSDNGHGAGSLTDLAHGIRWAADHGADVISISYDIHSDGSDDSPNIRELQAAIIAAQDQGVLVVAAAGNSNNDHPTYPAALPGVLAVAASDYRGKLAHFALDDTTSNDAQAMDADRYGTSFGHWVDVAAPGAHIPVVCAQEDGAFCYLDGTSYATPIAAGAAARIAQYCGDPHQIATILEHTATTIPADPEDDSRRIAHGIINLAAALRQAKTTCRLTAYIVQAPKATYTYDQPDDNPTTVAGLVFGGHRVEVVCQTHGHTTTGNSLWYRLTDGHWLPASHTAPTQGQPAPPC